MNWWLRVLGEPVRQFHLPGAAPGSMDTQQWQGGILDPAATIRSDVAAEGGNVSVTLNNSTGQVSTIYGQAPPLGAGAEVLVDDEVIFAGVVMSVTLGASASLEIQA